MSTIERALPQTPAAVPAYKTAAISRRWVIVGLLTLGVIVAYIDRVNLSIAVIDPTFKSFFNLTAVDRGLAGSTC
jgi:MFS transporter, ACS family, D-galactonate transporter